MTPAGILYVISTVLAFLGVVAIIVLAVRDSRKPKFNPQEPIGVVRDITYDGSGMYATIDLNDNARKHGLFPGDGIAAVSLGFRPDGSLMDASVVPKMPECNLQNPNVCVAIGCYGRSCMK